MEAAERDALLHSELHSKNFLSATRLSGHLGLVIARQLILLMNGEFGIKSGAQQGSTLWLTLPLDPERLEHPDLRPRRPAQGCAGTGWWTTTTPAAKCWCSNAPPGA
jgi:hypothetical protein